MKKFLLLFSLVVMSAMSVYSQEQKSVVVVLKNGTTITGQVKEFDPVNKIVLNVGGLETSINMSDVNSVNTVMASTEAVAADEVAASRFANLPKDTVINICGVDVKFVLMKGGNFKYGFDGRGSLSMDSEPVHDVKLSPFYVSEEFVSRDLYKAVTLKDYPSDFTVKYAYKKIIDPSLQDCAFFVSKNLLVYKKVPLLEDFMSILKNSIGGDRLNVPTEVQWFYSELHKAELKTPTYLYCQFAMEVSMSEIEDPAGQSIVVKGYTKHNDKDEFEMYRLLDRASYKMTNINNLGVWGEENEYEIYPKRYFNVPLCPIRLVMTVK